MAGEKATKRPGSNKRKRESGSTFSDPSQQETQSASTGLDTPRPAPDTAQVPFAIEILKDTKSKPKKRRVGTKGKPPEWSDVREEDAIDRVGPRVAYTVCPGGEWDAVKRYKNFVVSNKTFGVNDYVYINHSDARIGDDVPETGHFWVARVLEIRAMNQSNVFLRVYWMYWPDELPNGRQPYHGRQELVASNHMEIVDAMTVSDGADVVHVAENDEDASTVDGLYWRQTFDCLTNKVSTLKRDCICKSYHNPDRLLIRCPNHKCAKWLHELCVLEDALKTKWSEITDQQSTTAEGEDNNGDGPATETIQVKKFSGKPNGINGVPRKRGRGGRKSSTYRGAQPWEGQLEAKLDMKTDAWGKETSDITGKIIINDLRDEQAVEKSTVDVVCLFCRTRIVGMGEEEEEENEDEDEDEDEDTDEDEDAAVAL